MRNLHLITVLLTTFLFSNAQLHTYRKQRAKEKKKKAHDKIYKKKNRPPRKEKKRKNNNEEQHLQNQSPAIISGRTSIANVAKAVSPLEYDRQTNISGLFFHQRKAPLKSLSSIAGSKSRLGKHLNTQQNLLNNNATYCMREKFLCKYTPECTPYQPPCVGKVFITGCSGSGTHAVWSTLQSITSAETKVTHEKSQKGATVLVSWPTRCIRGMVKHGEDTKVELDYSSYGFAQSETKLPMVLWAQKQLNGVCKYQTLVHVVRHPLSFLSSNLAFGQCVECWTLVEQFSVPPISELTTKVRTAILHNREAKYEQRGGRVWDEKTRNTLLEAFMLYWVTWNRMIESVADMRFRIEHTEIRELCALLKLGSRSQCLESPIQKLKTGGHGGFKDTITWKQTQTINAELSEAVWALAEHYGYKRDIPQRYKLPAGMQERDDSAKGPVKAAKERKKTPAL